MLIIQNELSNLIPNIYSDAEAHYIAHRDYHTIFGIGYYHSY